MSTPRMMKKLTSDRLRESSKTITRHTSEQELLEHHKIDTAYYHPSKHPHAKIRNSFDSKKSPEIDANNIDSSEESRMDLKK